MSLENTGAILAQVQAWAASENVRVTQHAQQEMIEEDILLDEVLQAIATGSMLENYPTHHRGPCCLVSGVTATSRPLHIVCSTAQPTLIIITVYEPKPPKCITPVRRRR